MKISGTQQNLTVNKTTKQKSTAKKIAKVASLALPLAVVAVGIGRNPVKAARYLTGNLNIRKKAYIAAEKMANDNIELINKALKKINIKQYLKDMPEELMPQNNIFFHGSRRSSGIYRHGLSPYSSGQLNLSGREFGAGLYVTPDERVAQNFTYITGKIVPVKIENAKLAIADSKVGDAIQNAVGEIFLHLNLDIKDFVINRKKYNALNEIIARKAFIDAGYDGIYLERAVTSGIFKNVLPDTNKIFGMEQKQVVLFDTTKAQIMPRNLKERTNDIGKSFAATCRQLKNSTIETFKLYKHIFKIIKGDSHTSKP